MRPERLFLATAMILGLAYLFVSPPFRVPDEVAHFWRAEAIAGGHFVPSGERKADSARIPQGLKTLVWVMQERADFRMAYDIPLEPVKEPLVQFPASYTPIPYLPQALAALITRLLNVRPLIAFYAGRLANLAAGVTIILFAMRIAPELRAVFGAVALLPMTLFLLASWSADALTIAVSLLLTAMLLAKNEPPLLSVAAVAAVVSLCKPAYFLIAAMVLVSKSRARIAAVAGATTAGTAVALWYARLAFYPQRKGLPLDPVSQLRCIAADPLRFARVMLHDLATNGLGYIEQAIGRLGTMDVKLPAVIIGLEVALLIVVALTSGIPLTAARRVLALAIVLVTAAGVILSQYLTWSIVCHDVIEGVQGRYFLPVVPLALAALTLPRSRWRIGMGSVVAIAMVCNAVAVATLIHRYWW